MRANSRSDLYASVAVDGGQAQERSFQQVEDAFASLPQRYRGADEGFSARYRIELEDLGTGWGVELGPDSCVVVPGNCKDADVVIGTDSQTWLQLREGKLSGLDAFRSRRLWARGHMDLAIAFEGFFRLPHGRPPLLRLHQVKAGKARISTLTAGNGVEHVVLIHGLGGTKSSFYETVSGLAPRYTVHAVDLPGFGASSKSSRAPYDYPWFARAVIRLLACFFAIFLTTFFSDPLSAATAKEPPPRAILPACNRAAPVRIRALGHGHVGRSVSGRKAR